MPKIFLSFVFSGLLLSGGGIFSFAEESPTVSTALVALPSDPVDPEYVFNASIRDPFIPLVGAASDMPSMARASKEEPGAFNPGSMDLKGILRMPTGRWAVLTAPTGETYVVENGKVRDPKRKVVEGYVGFIKEKSLVIIGPNNQVTELKLKKDQEKEAKP